MIKITSVVLVAMAALSVIGGLLMVASLNYASGALVIQAGKTQQFSYGLTLLTLGAVGLAFVAWFYAVNGRNSIFRRRPRPWWPSPPS